MGDVAEERSPAQHPARILVSSTRKPVSYINLAKRYLQEHGEVQISALGTAVSPAVTVAEILKSKGLALEKQITTSLELVGVPPRAKQKPKIDITLTRTADFDSIIAAVSHPSMVFEDGVPDHSHLDGVGQDGVGHDSDSKSSD